MVCQTQAKCFLDAMRFWSTWLMTRGRLPDISGFPSGCRRGGLAFTELHGSPPWWVPCLLGSPSHGQPGLLWWLFLVPHVTGSHARAVPRLTSSLCSRASLLPWAQQNSLGACVCLGPLSQAGEAPGYRLRRWAHSHRQAGPSCRGLCCQCHFCCLEPWLPQARGTVLKCAGINSHHVDIQGHLNRNQETTLLLTLWQTVLESSGFKKLSGEAPGDWALDVLVTNTLLKLFSFCLCPTPLSLSLPFFGIIISILF